MVRSLTVRDTRTSPSAAASMTRDAMWTARPLRSDPRSSTSPVWTPARVRTPRAPTCSLVASAHETARPGLSKRASIPSPVCFTTTPRWRATSWRQTSSK